MEDVLKLSVPERVQLIGDIWDSIAADQQTLPLTQAQRDEIDRRLEDEQHYPQDGSPWEEVKDKGLDSLS